ncbi:hypothetical protein K438DRAFT_1756099 [Mycena galopus ATCC 62051]|nr:hypothetical protein K438DRAFT_1756099 [Mycena galopus ATCC 62051]
MEQRNGSLEVALSKSLGQKGFPTAQSSKEISSVVYFPRPRKYIKSQDEEEVSNSKRNYPSFRKKRCDYGTRMEIEYLVEEPNLNLKLIPMDIFAIGGYFAPTDWQSTRGYNSSSSFGVSRPVMSSINITR